MTSATINTGHKTISQRLAEYIVGLRFEDIPPSVIHKTKDLLAYRLGLALAGRTTPGQQAVDIAFDLSGAGGSCAIIGRPRRADVLEAVFANAALMTVAGRLDYLFPSGVHPGVVAQPVAWSVGEMTRASGRQLLTAVVIGYDIMAKLHSGVLPYDIDVPRPLKFVVEPFGAAATAARLFGLSVEQTVHALGHAGQSSTGVFEGAEGLWVLHPLAARNGAMATMLARAGMPAVPTIVEGTHGIYRSYFLTDVPDSVVDNVATLGQDFEIAKAQIQKYPISGGNVNPVDLTQMLITEHGLTPNRVAAIELVLSAERATREAIYDTINNKVSPKWLLAFVLADGRLDSARLEGPLDMDLLGLRDKVRLRFEEGRSFFYARVDITTVEGVHHTAESSDVYAWGSFDRTEWLIQHGQETLSTNQLTRLAESIENLEHVADVSAVMAHVTTE